MVHTPAVNSISASRLKKIPPSSFGFDHLREHSNPERIYAAQWRIENRRRSYINSGYTLLEHILCERGKRPTMVSRRDAAVAAAVMQWLGTNCGFGFLQTAEAKIARADFRAMRRNEERRLHAERERQAAHREVMRKAEQRALRVR